MQKSKHILFLWEPPHALEYSVRRQRLGLKKLFSCPKQEKSLTISKKYDNIKLPTMAGTRTVDNTFSQALTLGWIVVAITTMARMRVCSTSIEPMLVAGRIIRSAPCFLWHYGLEVVKKYFFKTQNRRFMTKYLYPNSLKFDSNLHK